MTVGERIKERRIELGMSQTDLAIKMGYKTKSSICEVEKGGDNLTQCRIYKFAEALNTTPSKLMGLDGGHVDFSLSGSERDMIIEYRNATAEQREMIDRLFDLINGRAYDGNRRVKLGGDDK